jgi:hypothetical protein
MRYRLRTLPLLIACVFILAFAFDFYRFCVTAWAAWTRTYPNSLYVEFGGIAVAWGLAAASCLILALPREGTVESSARDGKFRFKLRTLLVVLAVLPALIGLGYVFRDWIAGLVIDEWIMRGIP